MLYVDFVLEMEHFVLRHTFCAQVYFLNVHQEILCNDSQQSPVYRIRRIMYLICRLMYSILMILYCVRVDEYFFWLFHAYASLHYDRTIPNIMKKV